MVQAIMEADTSKSEANELVNGDVSLRLKKMDASETEKTPSLLVLPIYLTPIQMFFHRSAQHISSLIIYLSFSINCRKGRAEFFHLFKTHLFLMDTQKNLQKKTLRIKILKVKIKMKPQH